MNLPPQNIWDRRLAAPMFVTTLAFLTLLGASAEWARLDPDNFPNAMFWLIGGIHALFVIEFLFFVLRRDQHWGQRALCCLLPPLRLCGRDYSAPRRLWLPRLGWRDADEELEKQMEKSLSLPMIFIALMILPLLAIEHYWAAAIEENAAFRALMAIATIVIWLAFTIEFFVMIAVTENKFDYCKRNWMDIVIICLPFVAFLRFLRVGRALRLYRLRGVSMRVWLRTHPGYSGPLYSSRTKDSHVGKADFRTGARVGDAAPTP